MYTRLHGRLSLFLSILLLLISTVGITAQETDEQLNIDDLFGDSGSEENASESPPESGAASGDKVDLGTLTTSPTEVTGKVSASLGIGAGLMEWPGSAAAEGSDVAELLRFSGFYSTRAAVSVDTRPQPYLRFFGTLETFLVGEEMRFEYPTLDELFIDYTLMDTVFFRVGKQKLRWGQGLLLDNPADLVSRVSDGISFRSTLPAGSGTFNTVIYSKNDWTGFGKTDPRSFAYAGQWEFPLGPFAAAISGHFKPNDDEYENIAGALSNTFAVGPIDAAVDLVAHWDGDALRPAPADWQLVSRFLWENQSRSWSVIGEYQFDSVVSAWRGHYGALAVRMPKIGSGSWRPAIRWKHAFQDHSGEVVAGVNGTVAPKLNLSIGVPVVYGSKGSYYRAVLAENADKDESELEEDQQIIPIDNVISLLLSISLSFSF